MIPQPLRDSVSSTDTTSLLNTINGVWNRMNSVLDDVVIEIMENRDMGRFLKRCRESQMDGKWSLRLMLLKLGKSRDPTRINLCATVISFTTLVGVLRCVVSIVGWTLNQRP